MFTAGVFTHSALRCHLTPQQQNKTDEERSANNRWRGQRRQILQQGALLPCRLTYRRLPPTVHCGALPRTCLTQVLKMFVLLSYEVVPQAGQRQPYRRCCYQAGRAPRPGAPGRPGDGPQNPRGCHGGRPSCPELRLPAPGTALLLTIVSHRYWRPCGRPRPGPRPGPRHRFLATANQGSPASSSQFTALSPDDLRRAARARPRPPGNDPSGSRAREVRGGGTAVGVTFRLMNGHRVAGSDRPPPAV